MTGKAPKLALNKELSNTYRMTTASREDQIEVMELAHRSRQEGDTVYNLDWGEAGIDTFLFTTVTGAHYLVEARPDKPALVSRLSEIGPLLDYSGPRLPIVIVRYEGNPDKKLRAGKSVDILGLSKRGPEWDPDSIYTTAPLVEIRYILEDTNPRL